jgi:hypothetical protein
MLLYVRYVIAWHVAVSAHVHVGGSMLVYTHVLGRHTESTECKVLGCGCARYDECATASKGHMVTRAP